MHVISRIHVISRRENSAGNDAISEAATQRAQQRKEEGAPGNRNDTKSGNERLEMTWR